MEASYVFARHIIEGVIIYMSKDHDTIFESAL
jgi:hypothetical protein